MFQTKNNIIANIINHDIYVMVNDVLFINFL